MLKPRSIILRCRRFKVKSCVQNIFFTLEKIFSYVRKILFLYKIFFFFTFQIFFLEREKIFLDVRFFLLNVLKILFPHRHARMQHVWQKKDVWGVKKRLSHDFLRHRTIFFRRRTHSFRRRTDVFDVERRFFLHFLFCHNAGFCHNNVTV